jgi:hypothetical protein
MAYVYVYASVNPLSAMAAALHHSQGSWIVYQICLPIVTVAAGLANLVILVGGIRLVSRSFILSLLAAVVAFMPIWSPYVLEAALRKHLWNTECNGFDGSFLLEAAHYNQQPYLSVVQFPNSFGGQKWTLYQSSPGIYDFAPVGEDSQVTYNFINQTYSLHTNTTQEGGALTPTNAPLSFPQFGLYSEASWIRSCFAPAVELKNSTGNVIIKTGLTAYTDCSKMEVCAMKSMGMNGVIVAIGRILMALENGASCCTRSRWR